jgi:hypothetical protein
MPDASSRQWNLHLMHRPLPGYAMFLLNSPAEAYTLSQDGSEPVCLQVGHREQQPATANVSVHRLAWDARVPAADSATPTPPYPALTARPDLPPGPLCAGLCARVAGGAADQLAVRQPVQVRTCGRACAPCSL